MDIFKEFTITFLTNYLLVNKQYKNFSKLLAPYQCSP